VFLRYFVGSWFLFFCSAGFFGLHGPFLFRLASNLGRLGSDKLPIGAATLPPEGTRLLSGSNHYRKALRGSLI